MLLISSYVEFSTLIAFDRATTIANFQDVRSNISKTSASVSSGVPNTEKIMKARGRTFIVSRCLEPLMKHEARVFDMVSQMKQ